MALHFVIIGGGPAGHTAATHAARLGARVTIVERDIVGGAAHLWDCIPSKAMIATGGAMALTRRARGMGLAQLSAELDEFSRADGARASGKESPLEAGAAAEHAAAVALREAAAAGAGTAPR